MRPGGRVLRVLAVLTLAPACDDNSLGELDVTVASAKVLPGIYGLALAASVNGRPSLQSAQSLDGAPLTLTPERPLRGALGFPAHQQGLAQVNAEVRDRANLPLGCGAGVATLIAGGVASMTIVVTSPCPPGSVDGGAAADLAP